MTWITMSSLGRYGRLGNQMFQCAALLGLAARWKLQPCLTETGARVVDVFQLNWECVAGENFPPPVCEPSFLYCDELLREVDKQANVDIAGYFQTEKYWKQLEPKVRETFQFRDGSVDVQAQHYINSVVIPSRPVVCIGVRRGDYWGLPQFYPFPDSFYDRAIVALKEKFGLCTYLIVSDDESFSKNYFTQRYSDFGKLEFPQGSDLHHLALMKFSDHVVIANSSFHWWGAWLNSSPQKQVFAPKTWFGSAGPKEWHDIYCEGWQVL